MSGHVWPKNYDPELSMQNAMVKAEELMVETIFGTMEVAVLAVRLSNVDTWVRIAQVHATNMQTQAIRQARLPLP